MHLRRCERLMVSKLEVDDNHVVKTRYIVLFGVCPRKTESSSRHQRTPYRSRTNQYLQTRAHVTVPDAHVKK